MGVKVYGISTDDVASLAKFHKDQGLNFPLLSDPDGSVARKYGVLSKRGYANRITFVIDERGVIIMTDESVDVSQHGSDLAGRIREAK
ncbi:MAG: peroxiredoxin Q/BCP [Planctomycetota bacterium]|jgi:peroxiredoxin Q/BCP